MNPRKKTYEDLGSSPNRAQSKKIYLLNTCGLLDLRYFNTPYLSPHKSFVTIEHMYSVGKRVFYSFTYTGRFIIKLDPLPRILLTEIFPLCLVAISFDKSKP